MKDHSSKRAIDMDDIMCPICGEYQMKHFGNVCPICGWEHTPTGLIDPDFLGGQNPLSLHDYKKWFLQKRESNPNYKWKDDPDKHELFHSVKETK